MPNSGGKTLIFSYLFFFGMRKRGPVNFGAEIAVCEFGC